MSEHKPDKPRMRTLLTRDIQNFVRKRAEHKPDEKTTTSRKHVEIQLLITELDNILLRMNSADTSVILAREKLSELKQQINKTLDIK
jgi:hypothetical protein